MSKFDFTRLDGLSDRQQVDLLIDHLVQSEASPVTTQRVIQFRGIDFTVREYPLMLGFLYGRGSMTRETAWAAIYAGRPEAQEPVQTDILNIFIRRARVKLQPFGVFIHTVYGDGWRMPSDSFHKFEALVIPITITELEADLSVYATAPHGPVLLA